MGASSYALSARKYLYTFTTTIRALQAFLEAFAAVCPDDDVLLYMDQQHVYVSSANGHVIVEYCDIDDHFPLWFPPKGHIFGTRVQMYALMDLVDAHTTRYDYDDDSMTAVFLTDGGITLMRRPIPYVA